MADLDELILRAKEGDAWAFGQLYDLHVDRMYRHIAYRVGNNKDAEDLTQEVFIRAWRAIGKYKITSTPFVGWLMRISHNLVVDTYRKRSGESETYLEDWSFISDPAPSPQEATESVFTRERLRQAIRLLPGDYQQVILMRFIEGFSYSEIASTLNVREGAIRVRQYRALRQLRTILEGEKGLR